MGSFFYCDGILGDLRSGEDEVALVGDDPFDDLSLVELHGLSDGGGEVDVPLLAALSLYQLDFGRKAHDPKSSYITRLMSSIKSGESFD